MKTTRSQQNKNLIPQYPHKKKHKNIIIAHLITKLLVKLRGNHIILEVTKQQALYAVWLNFTH